MASRFISNNGLVEDPCAVEKERCVINPWTSEEKEIFLDKFALFGKDFRRIQSFLDHKTVADCVEFYYKNHKSDRFEKTKKNPNFAKLGKSHSTNTYLVTSGKRWHRDTYAASLNILGAASAIASNVDGGTERQKKCTSKFYIGTSSDHRLPRGEGGAIERSSSLVLFDNERETAAADVLAGICGSMSSEALSSSVTSSVHRRDVHHQEWRCQKKRGPLIPRVSQNAVDEETCSDESCGGEMDPTDWTDEEKSRFIRAVAAYGKDFSMISRCMRTRSREQCKVFFSKARKCLGLDTIHLKPCNEGANNADRGDGSDHEDACMVDAGSVTSRDKFPLECKMEVENEHLSDSKAEHAESDLNVVNDCRDPELAKNKPEAKLVGERTAPASDCEPTETAKLEEAPPNTDLESITLGEAVPAQEMIDQPSPSGAEGEADTVNRALSRKFPREGIKESEHQLSSGDRFDTVISEMRGLNPFPAEPEGSGGNSLDSSIDHKKGLELNALEKLSIVALEQDNCFGTPNSFLQGSSVIAHSKTLSEDNTLARIPFRKSNDRLSQRSSSTDGYHRHLPKHSLLDCVESAQALRSGYPATVSINEGKNGWFSNSEPRGCSLQECNRLNHEKGLVSDTSLPGDQKHNSSSDVEKPSRSCDVKLFGQILTHSSSHQQQQPEPKPKCSTQETDDKQAGKFLNLKFENHSGDRNLAPPNLDKSSNNLSLRSYGFWDGSRIQTGFASLPDSTVLLAKYPSAFGNSFTPSKLEQNSNVSGLSSNNRGADYHVYRSREFVHPLTADKFMQRRKESDALSRIQGRNMVGINVVGRETGILVGGVSDPVAALKMHYAKAEPIKNGRDSREAESWRSGGGDISTDDRRQGSCHGW